MRPSTGTVLTAVLILPLLTVLPATVRAQAPDWPGPRNRPAAVRLEVTPRATRVYVDATYAGVVDDFDGLFQRLHVVPGRHEIVLYLDGYRTIRQTMDLRAGADSGLRRCLQAEAKAEASDRTAQLLVKAAGGGNRAVARADVNCHPTGHAKTSSACGSAMKKPW